MQNQNHNAYFSSQACAPFHNLHLFALPRSKLSIASGGEEKLEIFEMRDYTEWTMNLDHFDSFEQESIFWEIVRVYEYQASRYQKYKTYIINRRTSLSNNRNFKIIKSIADFIIDNGIQDDIPNFIAAQFNHLKGNDDRTKWNYPWLNKLKSKKALNKYLQYKKKANQDNVTPIWKQRLLQDYETINYEVYREIPNDITSYQEAENYVYDTVIKLIYHPAITISPYYFIATTKILNNLVEAYDQFITLQPSHALYDYLGALIIPTFKNIKEVVDGLPDVFYTRLIQERTRLDKVYNFKYESFIVYYSFRSVASGR